MSFGKVGPTGEQGFIGVRGNSGDTGYGGITGYPGEFYIGPTFTGATGYNGYQGERGFTGERGDTGINGNTGGTGLMGNTTIGAQGPQGPRGDTGITGNYLPGTQGIAGPNGSTGYTGSTGIKGNTGNTGYRGYQGPDGYIFLDTLPAYTGYTGVVLPMPVCANNSEASLSSLALVTRLNNAVNTQGYIQEDFLMTSGTYVIPNNTYEVDVEIQGGGGGGGGSSTSDVGGGGGGSGFNVTKRMLVTPGQSFAYTIGNGGNGGLSGTDGTASVFGSGNATITALGGKGGAVGLSNIQGGNGGTGGFGGGGGYINNILYPTRNNQTLYQIPVPYDIFNGFFFADAVFGGPFSTAFQLPGPIPFGITQNVISQSGDRIIFNGSSFILNPITNEWEQSNILNRDEFGNNDDPRMYKSRGSVDGTLQFSLGNIDGSYEDSGKNLIATWTQGNTIYASYFAGWYTEYGPRSSTVVGSTGYTAAFAGGMAQSPMLRNLANYAAVSNDKKYLAVGGGGFSGNTAGPTGAVWTYFLGPTGVVNPPINNYPLSFNTQLTDPALRMTNSTISFSEPITAGWEGTLLIGGLNNSFQNAAVLWEVGTGTWVKRQTITSSVQGSTGEWYIGPLTRDVFYTQTEGGVYTLRYMKYPNLTFAFASIVFQYPYSVSYSVSTDGNFVYVFNNTLINVAFYQKQTADTNFTLRYTIPLSGLNNFYGTGVGYRLFGPFDNSTRIPAELPIGFTGYKSYVPPNGAGVGGSSQHSYISAGASGTVSAGGAGTMNGNVKPVSFNASGGGFGGGFDDAGAASNSGGGGTGRVSQPGTNGGSGYIKVRRFNPGV